MDTIVTEKSYKNFYPTPRALADKMLEHVDFNTDYTFLEPSAGKGDLIKALAKQVNELRSTSYSVDCIEIDPNLVQILKYNFSDEYEQNIAHQLRELQDKKHHYERYKDGEPLTKQDEEQLALLKERESEYM